MTRLTRTRHRPGRNPAAQQSPAVPRYAILSVGSVGGPRGELALVHHAARQRGCAVGRSGRARNRARGWGASGLLFCPQPRTSGSSGPRRGVSCRLRDFTLLPDDLSFEPFAIMLPRGDWHFDSRSTLLSHTCFAAGKSSGSTLNTSGALAWALPTGLALCSCLVACQSDCGRTR